MNRPEPSMKDLIKAAKEAKAAQQSKKLLEARQQARHQLNDMVAEAAISYKLQGEVVLEADHERISRVLGIQGQSGQDRYTNGAGPTIEDFESWANGYL